MEELFLEYRHLQATDLHIRANKKLAYRKNGEFYFSERVVLQKEIDDFLEKQDMFHKIHQTEETSYEEVDFSFQDEEGRYRINLSFGQGGHFLTVRIVKESLPNFSEELYRVFEEISKISYGLVLVTGSTGAGKSTTLRFFLEEYNKNYAKKIITLEDPIEYFYKEKKSIFFQREIGRDSKNFAGAIRSSLRQDPDILLIGEIRDAESLDAALYFAESGHLVFSTLHTENCIESIHKMLALSPKEKQQELRQRLSNLLRWMIAQELLRAEDGSQYAVYEILKNTKAVANIIFSGREIQLPSVLTSSLEDGMCSKEQNRKKYKK